MSVQTIQEAREKLKLLQRKKAAYNHAMGLIYYDAVTSAPKGTASNREQTLTVLSEEAYKLSAGQETVSLLESLEQNQDLLSQEEKRQVFLLLKEIRQIQKIPLDEYLTYQQLLVQADDVWHTAKEQSNFALFEPLLEKIFETQKRFAFYFAPDRDPYDFYLSEYEEGLSRESCDRFFATVKECLVPLLKKLKDCPPIDDHFLIGDFPEEKQEELARYLMETMGLDSRHVGLASTEHPFTTSLGSHLDERITTHYYRDNFVSSLYSVVHEGGHALYDTGSRPEFAYTCLDGGVSMGIHESQSRFYENILGRSQAFVEFLYPKLCQLFPSLSEQTPKELYRAINQVKPSLIRTEADEVTYCLHVMVRYELEKQVMAGECTVHELPERWNQLYKDYLGVEVPNDRQGVLQDSHWSGGSIGYFPSYALGSAYGAQFLQKMQESVPVEACLRKGDFAPINAWNREQIWQYGCLYSPKELLNRVLGEEFNPAVYLHYLESKVSDVYGL